MSENGEKIIAILDEMAGEASSVCSYAAGLSDGLKAAAFVVKKNCEGFTPSDQVQFNDEYRPNKQDTQKPVIDLLRLHGALSITDLIKLARSEGRDLLRPSVRSALAKLETRGLVVARNSRYQLTSFEDS